MNLKTHPREANVKSKVDCKDEQAEDWEGFKGCNVCVLQCGSQGSDWINSR